APGAVGQEDALGDPPAVTLGAVGDVLRPKEASVGREHQVAEALEAGVQFRVRDAGERVPGRHAAGSRSAGSASAISVSIDSMRASSRARLASGESMYLAARYSMTDSASPVLAIQASRSSQLKRWVSPSAGLSLRARVEGAMSMSPACVFMGLRATAARCATYARRLGKRSGSAGSKENVSCAGV